jgi:hypothetical protein
LEELALGEDWLALGEDWRALGEELALEEECLEPIIKRHRRAPGLYLHEDSKR